MSGRVVTVAAPPVISNHLEQLREPWLEVVPWAGKRLPSEGGIDAARVQVWVPPYGVGTTPEWVSERLASLPSLEVVQLLSAGVEPWPDLMPSGVHLCSGRGVHGGSTAELALALILATIRELPRYDEQQRRREWQRHEPDSIAGRRVLILGAGDIGQRLGRSLELLGARVALIGRTARSGVLSWSEVGPRLPTTDVLVVAVPHTAQTHGLVNAALLADLPSGALVVNVARGAIVDLEALTAEVATGRLRAALDVTDPEPLPADHALWSLPGCMITPHVGGGAHGWEGRARDLVEAQLRALHSGTQLANRVTAGY